MFLELDRNEILKNTITEKFAESVRENLLLKVGEKYGEGYLGIVMYEDFLTPGFEREGVWYYPLTVRTADGPCTEWICWDVSDKSSFHGGIPYSYVGEGLLEFAYATNVPDDFLKAFSGRAIDFQEDVVKVKVCSENSEPTFLSGKYSQSFIDELARQITSEIEANLAVNGLSKSTIELSLVLANGTYMEHTSDNVTYRRLLMTDKGCQARDFWVKWTRLDGTSSYTVADAPSPDTVEFRLGEDVPQKIREKEFRFLARTNPQKYQSAMGKRTVTEWRELIKRAVKRGELEKVMSELEINERDSASDDRIKQLATEIGIATPLAAREPEIKESSDFERAMEMARAALMEQGISVPEEKQEAPVGIDLPLELTVDGSDMLEIDGEIVSCAPPSEIDAEHAAAGFSLDDPATEESKDEPPFDLDAELAEENTAPSIEILPRGDVDREEFAKEAALKLAEERAKAEAEAEFARLREESIRAEADAKARLRYEAEARRLLEEEKAKLYEEQERLRREVERLSELARLAEENRIKAENARLAEEEKNRAELLRREEEAQRLRAEIVVREKAEAREKERLSEAARLAVLEQQRKEEEQKLREEREREEAARLALEAANRAESERIEAERRQEAERIRREAEERAAEAAVKAPVKETEYMSKQAKLLFRRKMNSDSVKKEIRDIVEDTLVKNSKKHVPIHMKAYAIDDYTMNIDILKMPKNESELLVSIIKAIGNGGLGITKIILEDM